MDWKQAGDNPSFFSVMLVLGLLEGVAGTWMLSFAVMQTLQTS